MGDAVIVESVRSACGRARKGGLAATRAEDMGIQVIKGLLARRGLRLASVLLFRLPLFLAFVLLVWIALLVVLLCVGRSSGSEKHKQNCCADNSNSSHGGCCLYCSLSAAKIISCLLLTTLESKFAPFS